MNTRRVRVELALRMQNGGLTTQHDAEKDLKSFLIWPIFDRKFKLTFKWVKLSISFNFVFFTIRVDPTRTGGPS